MKLQGLVLNIQQTHGTCGLPPKCTFEISYFHPLLPLTYLDLARRGDQRGTHSVSDKHRGQRMHCTERGKCQFLEYGILKCFGIDTVYQSRNIHLLSSVHSPANSCLRACRGPRINLPGIRLISGPQFYICL